MQPPSSQPARPRLRLRVTAAAETRLRARHPWLFADSIREQNRPGNLGELAVIYDRNDRFLAAGLFDPGSPIRVRVLQAGKPQAVDSAWWSRRLEEALGRRAGLFDERTTGYRCINGESDGWPGLVLDHYGETLVLKIYTAAWLPRLQEITDLLGARLHPARIVLRLSRNIQQQAGEFSFSDGQVLAGEDPGGPVVFLESGLKFEAEVIHGQKTGFFLDQRENRRAVERLAAGGRVLNAFSFSGGFSLYAARGGARAVTDLDISPHALASSRRNFELNSGDARVAACAHECVQADAFEWLEGRAGGGAQFDLIVLDPPSMARRESERAGALHAYAKLASRASDLLTAKGVLVACSCSAHVGAAEFFTVMRKAAAGPGRKVRELKTTGHAPDHPAAFDEANYLKAIYLELG